MIDSLLHHRSRATLAALTLRAHGLDPALIDGGAGYGVVTMHRPSNVDDKQVLEGILAALQEISTELPIIFPIHPRTRGRMAEFGLSFDKHPGVRLLEPLGYVMDKAIHMGSTMERWRCAS